MQLDNMVMRLKHDAQAVQFMKNKIFIYNNQLMGNCNQKSIVVSGFNSFTNNTKTICSTHLKQQKSFLNGKYSFLQVKQDKVLGKYFIVKDRISNAQLLLKNVYFTLDEDYFLQIEQLLKKKLIFYKNPQVLQIKGVIEYDTPLTKSNLYRLGYIIQKPASNLKSVFYRKMVQKQLFSQNQIINFLSTTIRGYSTLQSSGSKNAKIRMNTIQVHQEDSEQMSFKVIDDYFIIEDNNFQINKRLGFYSFQTEAVYLSPQQFIGFVNQSKMILVDQKSGIFSLGAIVLTLCLMHPIKTIYNDVSKYIDSHLLNSLINIAIRRYGDFVGVLLAVMLQLNQEKRPRFSELLEILEKLQTAHHIRNIQIEELTEKNDVQNPLNKVINLQTCVSQKADSYFSISI